MFEIGFTELLLIGVVGLLVIGPERLPEALRTLGLWVGRMRRSFNNVKAEIEKEIGMDEIRRQLHNEAVMEEMKRIERDVRDSVNASTSARHPAGTEPATPGAAGDAGALTPPNGSERSAELSGGPSADAPTNASAERPDGTPETPADGDAAQRRSASGPNDLPRDD